MPISRRDRIYQYFDQRETQDLLEIWEEHEFDEWDLEAFEIIAEILTERLGSPPPPSHKLEPSFQASELQRALQESESAVLNAPGLAEAYIHRGLVHDEMGHKEQAIADYRQALQLAPDSDEARDYLIDLLDEMEADFRQSASAQALDKAYEYLLDGRSEQAIQACELARQDLPPLALAHYSLGIVLEALGQYESALEAYSTALEYNPHYYPAEENFAIARLRAAAHTPPDPQDEDDYDEEDIDPEEEPGADETGFSLNEPPVPGWVYLDANAHLLAGWPGYRTRPGRSGYDPLDYRFEGAHVAGRLLHMLFTFKTITHNPVYLLVMAVFGIYAAFPIVLFYAELFTGLRNALLGLIKLIVLSPYETIGVLLLINVGLAFRDWLREL